MNHFEGRLATQPPAHYFANEEDAEDFVALRPTAVAYVVEHGAVVTTIFGDECK